LNNFIVINFILGWILQEARKYNNNLQ